VHQIRVYQPEDELSCIEIFDSNLPKYFTVPERDLFIAYLRRLNPNYFVAEIEGRVRGCGGFRVDDYGIAYLAWGMVHSTCHQQGIGSSLLHFRLEEIRKVDYAWAVLIDTSQHSAPFFARFGFEVFRTIPNGYQAGLDKVFMRLVWHE
jgi:ribosomal protein S18 acetylase RimI-like enzyme